MSARGLALGSAGRTPRGQNHMWGVALTVFLRVEKIIQMHEHVTENSA
jgi:hypothetical protein